MPAFSRSAAYYDSICAARRRDYDKEVADLAALVNQLTGGPMRLPEWGRRVVDWGCGTGEHVARWPNHGWPAVGIESSREMLERAAQKHVNVRHRQMHECRSGNPGVVDVSCVHTCLFAAFSYAAAQHLDACLESVRYNCARPGWFIFDVINHSAADCHLRTPDVLETPDVIRAMRKRFDSLTSLLTYAIDYEPRDGSHTFTESHVLRAFTPREITDALNRHGFDVLRIFNPECPERSAPKSDSFYFMVVARKR